MIPSPYYRGIWVFDKEIGKSLRFNIKRVICIFCEKFSNVFHILDIQSPLTYQSAHFQFQFSFIPINQCFSVQMVESYSWVSLYFYHIVYRFLRNFRICSRIVLPAAAFLVHCIIRHSTLPLFSVPPF